MEDYKERFRRAVEFVESHLTEAITLRRISEAACLSAFHFARVFRAYIGDTLAAYVRKRRLTRAAEALEDTDRSILDIAVEYRFGSQEAFTRAFKRQFHITPARRYAVFTHKGRLMEVGRSYDYIYKSWLPSSGMDFLQAEHFEYHGPGFTGDTPESETEIWIPLA